MPNPSIADTLSVCNDTEPRGLIVNTAGSAVQILTGASLLRDSNAPAALQVSLAQAPPVLPITASILGRIDGLDGIGIRAGVPARNFAGIALSRLSIQVAGGGSVSGSSAISAAGTANGISLIDLDNAGSLVGTAGPALTSEAPATAGFGAISNRATGTIGGIAAPFASLTNAGTIRDGGSRSAVAIPDQLTAFGAGTFFGNITNSGSIDNAGAAATIDAGGSVNVVNTGRIANAGTGNAITASALELDNLAGGTISTAGATALTASSFDLVNRGLIQGSVTVSDPTAQTASLIDTSAGGSIIGNVRLGAGNDTVIADYANGAIAIAVSGTLDAGGGTNTLVAAFGRDATVASPIALPGDFTVLGLAPSVGTTVTLGDGFAAPATIRLSGAGTLVNATNFAATSISGTDGTLTLRNTGRLSAATFDLSLAALDNSGLITATVSSPPLQLPVRLTAGSTVNSGTISVDATALGTRNPLIALGASALNSGAISVTGGGGVLAEGLTNTGSIVADGDALTSFGGAITNTGLISSRGAAGVAIGGSVRDFPTLQNMGEIDGADAGVRVDGGAISNYGSINSAGIGVVVSQSGGSIFNAAGATIAGRSAGIVSDVMSFSGVDNAGLIIGDVRFGSGSAMYTAQAGSRLQGNLDLGSGPATFITDIVNTGTGAFAGVDGTVSGTGRDTILYRVSVDTTAQLAPAGTFDVIGFQLQNGAHLTIGGDGFPLPIAFAGMGSVDLFADLAQNDQTIVSTGVALTTHGALALTNDRTGATTAGLVGVGAIANLGSIVVTDEAPDAIARVSAATSSMFTNGGTITLDNALATLDTPVVVNSGTISAAAGDRLSRGIVGSQSLTNSGSISTNGDAVLALGFSVPAVVTNSGTIASQSGIAIVAPITPLRLSNAASGRIMGGADQPAIFFASGSSIINAGTISGDLATASDSRGFYYRDANYHSLSAEPLTPPFGFLPPIGGNPGLPTLIQNTGTITGSVRLLGGGDRFENGGLVTGTVTLGDGDDTYVSLAGDQVSRGRGGTIDGGAGSDTIELHATDGTAAVPITFLPDRFTNFERLVQAEGVSAIANSASYQSIMVNGGTLVASKGSTIDARDGLSVASGATLRLAGSLNAATAVAGTLDVGTATGTITGNVAFQPGSALAVAIDADGIGRLAVTGNINVATGATLALSTNTAPAAGRIVTLVSTTGGITGTFTVSKPETVFGFVRQNDASIDLVGVFQPLAGNGNAARTVEALNATLVSGQANAALLAAAPALVDTDGSSRPAAFARLSPEPYAAADRMLVRDALAISEASRSGALASNSADARFYGFGQGIGGSLRLNGSASGAARMMTSGEGVIAGAGFGSTAGSVALFVGYHHDRQSLASLAAKAGSNGGLAGVAGSVRLAGFKASGLVAYLWGHARTTRTLPGGDTASARYRLNAFIADANARYPISVGAWTIAPTLGLLFVGSDRGRALENGSAAFDLSVSGKHHDYGFVEGGVRASYGAEDASISPWFSVGARRTLYRRGDAASANIIGTTALLNATSAPLSRTEAFVGAGARARIDSRMAVTIGYRGAFGSGSRSHAATGGISVVF